MVVREICNFDTHILYLNLTLVLQQIFKHMLPNFNKRWWDNIVLDVFARNTIGMP